MTQVLLLNSNMAAIKTVSLQRAISLISKGKVDVIEADPNRKLRSPSVTWEFPLVLRLRYFARVPKRKQTWSRRGVFNRDSWRCVYCGKSLDRETATIDHVIPLETCSKMGIPASVWSNTVCSCAKCNLRKTNRSLRDSGMKFVDPNYEPKTPRANYVIASGDVPSAWRVYLEI